MQTLLQAILADVKAQGIVLPAEQAEHYAQRYRDLLKQAENECPSPDEAKKPGQRGGLNEARLETCSNVFNFMNRMSCDS